MEDAAAAPPPAPPKPRQQPLESPPNLEKPVAAAAPRPPPAATAASHHQQETLKGEAEEEAPPPPLTPPPCELHDQEHPYTEPEAMAGAPQPPSPPPPQPPAEQEEEEEGEEEEGLTQKSPSPEARPKQEEGGERQPSPAEAEALRQKSLAEEKYRVGAPLRSALKHAKRALRLAPELDGLPQMVTALSVLRAQPGDHYGALLLDPFAHVNTVRRQYKALALALHPDKNAASLSAFPGSEDAFKRVGEAFRVLSDRARRREYDLRLRVELEAATREQEAEAAAAAPVEAFWTACAACRLFHQFDRRYVGQQLLCPRCKKSFLAVEVQIDGGDGGQGGGGRGGPAGATNSRVRAARSTRSSRVSGSNVTPRVLAVSRAARSPRPARASRPATKFRVPASQEATVQGKRKVNFGGTSEEPSPKRAKEKTLAEMQLELKGKSKSMAVSPRAKQKEKGKSRALVPCSSNDRDLMAMAVEDSDFYDFDRHRTEKSFKKGQIWGIYDDDDGMPRHYGMINEVLSTNPFRVKMSWLDVQSNGDEALLMWEKSGLHIACGRFKVGRTVDIDSVNFFSHPVECERAAKELYRIYPKKGSVWALYGEGAPAGGEGRHYDIVVLLMSYSEMYGLSMAYLVKVEGFKTIFKRREVGVHAVKWLEKDDTQAFSHQIPARKLSGSEGPGLPGECWELDPASLPPDLLQIDWKR